MQAKVRESGHKTKTKQGGDPGGPVPNRFLRVHAAQAAASWGKGSSGWRLDRALCWGRCVPAAA